MSCYEWERGTWRLNRSEYSKLAKGLRLAFDTHADAQLKLAKDVFTFLKTSKATRDQIEEFFRYGKPYETFVQGKQTYLGFGRYEYWRPNIDSLRHALWTNGKLTCPKRKHFPHSQTTTTTYNLDGDGVIHLFKDRHAISWNVFENNHACDRAHEHPIAKAFFALLNAVKWTRNTGGELVGNDEYNRDSYECDGGGNYSKGQWGNHSLSGRSIP